MSPDTQPSPEATPSGAPESPSANFKVELDLEDAPFLEEKEEAPQAPEKKAEGQKTAAASTTPPEEKKKGSALKAGLTGLLANKKRLAVIGGAALFILLAPVALMLFLSGDKKSPAPSAPTPEVITQSAAPPRQDAPPGPKFLYKAESFMVELRGSEGQIRFLRCRFSIPTENAALYGELRAKTVAVRDAIYYYLSNKPLTFLVDSKAHEALKRDLISVVNEHISADKIQDLYIEDYYVTGK